MPKAGKRIGKLRNLDKTSTDNVSPGTYMAWRLGDEFNNKTGIFFAAGNSGIMDAANYSYERENQPIGEYAVTTKNPYTFFGGNYMLRQQITGESNKKLEKLQNDDENSVRNYLRTDAVVAKWARNNGYDAVVYKRREAYGGRVGYTAEIQLLNMKGMKKIRSISQEDIPTMDYNYPNL